MGLEDIVKNFSEKLVLGCSGAARAFFAYPKLVGVAAAALFSAVNMDAETASFCAGIGVSAYGLAGIINEYVFGNRESVVPGNDSGLTKRVEHFVFNNAKPFAVAYGLAAAAFFGFSSYRSPDFTFLKSLNGFGSINFLLANSVLYLRRQNEFFVQAYSKLKSRNNCVRAWDYVLENPVIPSALAGGAVGAAILANALFGLKNTPVLTLEFTALASAGAAFGVYSVSTVAAALFHSSSLRFFKENARVVWHSALKNYEKAEAACVDLIELSDFPQSRSSHYLRLANLYFEQGKFDSGLLNLQRIISAAKEKKWAKAPFEWIRDFVLPNKLTDSFWRKITEKYSADGPVRSLNLAAYDFKLRRFESALQNLDSAIQQGGDEIGISIIKAAALECVDIEKSDSAWKDIVDTIIVQYKDRFERISFTSKEVLKLSFDELLANTFVFVRDFDSDSGVLRQEHDLSRFVFSCYDDLSLVPKQYYFGERDGVAYSASSRMSGLLLSGSGITKSDVLSSLQAYFDFCLRTTAGRHRMPEFSVRAPVLDYLQVCEDKFLGRLPVSEDKKARLRDYFLPVVCRLEGRPRCFTHGNFHPGNIIKASSGRRFGLIDFGDACFANICFGIEQFLGHDLVDADKEEMYSASYDFSGGASRDDFLYDCALSSAFVASHLFGRSVHYREGPPVHYRDNLAASVSFLAKNFVSGREKEGLCSFSEEIQGLDVE